MTDKERKPRDSQPQEPKTLVLKRTSGKAWELTTKETRSLRSVVRVLNGLYQQRFSRTPKGIVANRTTTTVIHYTKTGGTLTVDTVMAEVMEGVIPRITAAGVEVVGVPLTHEQYVKALTQIASLRKHDAEFAMKLSDFLGGE